jgi:hypothetical protein
MRFEVPVDQVVMKCNLFRQNRALTASPYIVQSSVPLAIFRQFVSVLDRNEIKITTKNVSGLYRLCDEFGFGELRAQLWEFCSLQRQKETEEAEARSRISWIDGLQAFAMKHGLLIISLFLLLLTFFRSNVIIQKLSSEITQLQRNVSALKAHIDAPPAEPLAQNHSKEITELRKDVSALQTKTAAAPAEPLAQKHSKEITQLQKDVSALKTHTPAAPAEPLAQKHSKEIAQLQKDVSAVQTKTAMSSPHSQFSDARTISNSLSLWSVLKFPFVLIFQSLGIGIRTLITNIRRLVTLIMWTAATILIILGITMSFVTCDQIFQTTN